MPAAYCILPTAYCLLLTAYLYPMGRNQKIQENSLGISKKTSTFAAAKLIP
jgi:hypothetical protein